MRTHPVRPYLTPDPLTVEAGPWLDETGATLAESVDHWDSATDLQLSRVVTVDADSVRQTCQLGSASALAVTATWHSDTTRLTGESPRSNSDPTQAASRSPSAWSSREPTSAAHSGCGPGSSCDTPEPVPASSLPSPSDRSCGPRTNGAQSRDQPGGFPMAVLDFTRTDYPDRAAWALSWGAGRLHEPVLGDFRLLLNSAHPTLLAAVRSRIG